MTEFRDQDLTRAGFERVSLRGATFTKVQLNDARMHRVDFTGARVRGARFSGSHLRGVEMVDVDIYGELQNVVVNGVDIAPLVDAELTVACQSGPGCAPTTATGSVRRGQSWSGCGRAPSRVRGRSPRRRCTVASMTSGP